MEDLDGRVHAPDRLVRRRHGRARIALACRVALRFARLVVHAHELRARAQAQYELWLVAYGRAGDYEYKETASEARHMTYVERLL